MKNKNVGFLVIGIAIIMSLIILTFNMGMKNIAQSSCSHGSSCSMHETIATQTWISLLLVGFVIIVGLILIFSKESEKVIVKTKTIKAKVKEKKLDLSGLNKKEKQVIKLLQEEKAIFQKELMEKIEIGKVGMTRLLDKLEAKQFIERKRRGMNNVVVLK